MPNYLANWLCSLPPEITTPLADHARRWLADLSDPAPAAEQTNLEQTLEAFLDQVRQCAEQKGTYDQVQITACPVCGKPALHTINYESAALWTDERDDEFPFERGIEVVQLSPGFTLTCRHSGNLDGEGATY